MILDPQRSFGEVMFGRAQLGNRRRTQRLAALTDQLCKHPGGSLPEKLQSPKDLKALYRLCDRPEVTHAALLTSLRQAVLDDVAVRDDDTILILHDASELDYSTHKSLAGKIGQVGRGFKHGYICHNSLAVTAAGREVLGLVGQILHRRVRAPKNEALPERRARQSRESRLWLLGTQGLPADKRLVDVADQGADTFEFLEHEVRSGRRFVIRAHHARKANVGHAVGHAVGHTAATKSTVAKSTVAKSTVAKSTVAKSTVQHCARSQPAIGGRTLKVAAQPRKGRRRARPARWSHLLISATPLLVQPPHAKHGDHGRAPLPMWVVRVWEPHPSKDADAIEWLLLTNEPVADLADAERVIGWYQTRWVIEELHKAMKTGCEVEQMQFTEPERLEPAIVLLTTVATTLLNLRAASQMPDAHTRAAHTLIDSAYVEVLSAWRYGAVKNLTVHEFFFALARLGGHQNRRNDKRPGWLILWRGWTTLQAMLAGTEINRGRKCG